MYKRQALDKVRNFGDLNEVLVVTNDKFYKDFQKWSETHQEVSFNISVINDHTKTNEDRLGSIGDIDFTLKEKAINEDVLIMGGDNLFDFNIEEFVNFSKHKSPHVSIGLYDIKDLNKAELFGVVVLDEENRIASFEEKPKRPKSTLIGMCLYYLPKDSLVFIGQYLSEVKKSDTAGGYIRWLREGYDVYGFQFEGKWYDIGSIASYQDAQNSFMN